MSKFKSVLVVLQKGGASYTHDELLQEVHYDPASGTFTRRFVRTNSGIKNRKAAVPATGAKDGYSMIALQNVQFRQHRVAYFYMTGEIPDEIDHINGVRSDNRWENIRSVNRPENCKNLPTGKANSSGVLGVNWHKASSKWRAFISSDREHRHLGLFGEMWDAICARKSAENELGFHANHGRIV